MHPGALKDLYERKARAMSKRPAFARGSGHARVRLGGAGLACEVEHPDRTLLVDLPAEDGGSAAAPHPGQLMRTSVGACLAMGYRIWGARLGVPLDAVEVEICCEYDSRGQMGLDPDVAVGWQRLQFHVTLTTAAAETDVRRLFETVNRLSPMLANLNADIETRFALTIAKP